MLESQEPFRSQPLGMRAMRFMPARNKRAALYALSLFLDIVGLASAFPVIAIFGTVDAARTSLVVVLLLVPLFTMFAMAREVQSVETLRDRALGVRRALGALIGAVLLLSLAQFLLKVQDLSRLAFLWTVGIGTIGLIVGEFLFTLIARAVVGSVPTAEVVLYDGVKPVPMEGMEVIDITRMGLSPDLARPEMIDAISRIIAPFDRVVISCTEQNRPAWTTFLKGSDVGGEILVDRSLLGGAVAIGSFRDHDTLVISKGPLNLANRLSKRLFDIVIASGLLLFLAPLLILTAIAIKLDSAGPVFFRQMRVGLGNRMFLILKFRSMHTDMADAAGNVSASRGDARITRVGRWIRRTSIDELPQLINVLRGEMSMVGPRPHALGSLAGDSLFWEVTDLYWIRHALKPGITGLAQIRGLRGATENREELERRVRCDLEYLSNWSLAEDMMILLRTFGVIVHDKAY